MSISTRLKLGLALLLLGKVTLGQVLEPAVGPQVVLDKAEEILSSKDASPCDVACTKLASTIPGHVHLGKAGHFDFWDAKQGDITPACRVEPNSASEVATTLQIVREAGCSFAVKSGGHSRLASASNADNGVTIDLTRLNSINLSTTQKTVTVGAGSRWAEVYDAIEPSSLLVIGGRVGDVGVGGLLLGGGISFLSGRYGFACDNILSYEIVLPNSTIITNVSETTHQDLYWALRGAGSSNYGIVTSFELLTVPQPNPSGLYYDVRTYPATEIQTLLEIQNSLLTTLTPRDLDAAYLFAFGYNQDYDVMWSNIQLIHTSHNTTTSLPPVFSAFNDIPSSNTPNPEIMQYSEITRFVESMNTPHIRNSYETITYRPSLELDRYVYSLIEEFATPRLKHVPGMLLVGVMQPIFTTAIELSSQRGGNALGLEPDIESGEPLNLLLFPLRWYNAEDDELCFSVVKEMLEKVEAKARELGVYHRFQYVNYMDRWKRGGGYVGYGEENLERLREIQRVYDPEGIFGSGGIGGGGYHKLGGDGEAVVPKGKGQKDSEKKTEL